MGRYKLNRSMPEDAQGGNGILAGRIQRRVSSGVDRGRRAPGREQGGRRASRAIDRPAWEEEEAYPYRSGNARAVRPRQSGRERTNPGNTRVGRTNPGNTRMGRANPGSTRRGRSNARAVRPGSAAAARNPVPRRAGSPRQTAYGQRIQVKARRRRQQRQQLLLNRLFAFCFLGVLLFGSVRGMAAILSYIEGSRESQRGEVETALETGGLDLSASNAVMMEETAAETAEDITVAESLQEDGNLVLSGGRYVDLTKPMVALTFDDGPERSVGNVLMDELEKVDGRGTFFIVGSRVEEFSDEVQRMVADGHEVANHSWDHDIHLSRESAEYIRQEFSKTDDAIRAVTGIETALIRLPGGNVSDTVKSVLTKPMIYWSIDTEDWRTRDAQSTIDSILPNIKDGDIVLMHELYTATAEACKVVIPELTARGFQLVTVSELIRFHDADVQGGNGKQYEWFPPKETEPETTAEADTLVSVSASDEALSGDAEGSSAASGDALDGDIPAPADDAEAADFSDG